MESINTKPVTVRVLGKTKAMNIAHTFEVGYGTEFPILGLYPDYLNTVDIIVGNDPNATPTETLYIQTEAVDASPVKVTVDNLDTPDEFNQDLYWVYHLRPCRNVAYDREGDIRYYFYDSANQGARIFYDQDDKEIRIQSAYSDRTLEGEVRFAANILRVYHHDLIKIQSGAKAGNYILLSFSTYGGEDRVIEQTAAGVMVKDVTFASLFQDIVKDEDELKILSQIIYDEDNIYQEDGQDISVDWAHANSVIYDENKDIMYFSLRCQAVIAVNYADWSLLWWMADETLDTRINIASNTRGEKINFNQIASLEPYRVGGAGKTDGPKNQHALYVDIDGDLGMFDNAGDQGNEEGSRYVSYTITGSKGSWSAIKKAEYKDSSLYSMITSDVDFTGEGNLLIGYGSELQIGHGSALATELGQSSEVIREVEFKSDGSGSKKVLLEIEVGQYFYRMDKMPIYPYRDTSKSYATDYDQKNGF